MKIKFEKIPNVLQKQIIFRLLLGALILILFVVLWILTKDFLISFPCLAFSVFLLFNSYILFNNCFNNKLIVLTGVCTDINKTIFKKHIKSLVIKTDEGKNLEIISKQSYRRLTAGDKVTVYLSYKTPVYEKSNLLLIINYYALEINK